MIATKSEAKKIDEMELFSQRLTRMLRFKYTHEDLDFCNTDRPVGYVSYMLRWLLKANRGLRIELLDDMRYLIDRWERDSAYLPREEDVQAWPWDRDTTGVDVNNETQLDEPDFLVRMFNRVSSVFFLKDYLIININKNISGDAVLKLPRYIATILCFTIQSKVKIVYDNMPNNYDLTPFLMLSNLFNVKFVFTMNVKGSFQQSVVKRLLKLNAEDSFVGACLKKIDQREVLLPLLKQRHKLTFHDTLDNVNDIIRLKDYDNIIGVHYFAHKYRMSIIAQLCRDENTIRSTTFDFYFKSVVELNQLCNQIGPTISNEIFNDALICDDLQIIISAMKKHNFPLYSFLYNLRIAFHSRTGWEAFMLSRLREEFSDVAKSSLASLNLIQNIGKHSYLSQFELQFLENSFNSLKIERDADIVMNASQQIIKYLAKQKKISSSLSTRLKQFFVKLLSLAQNQQKDFIFVLREYTNELIRLGFTHILQDVFNVLTQPKKARDEDHAYFSILALTRVVCVMINDALIDSYVERIEAMPETHNLLYRRYFQLYTNHYARLLSQRFKAQNNLNYAYELLKLYRFQKSENLMLVDRQAMLQALAITIDNVNADNDIEIDRFLIIESLPDFHSYSYIIDLYIRWRSKPEIYFQEISAAIFSLLLVPKGENETFDNYIDRSRTIIVLAIKYSIPILLFSYYLLLMGMKGGQRSDFNYITQEHPDMYIMQLLSVYQQFEKHFDKETIPWAFIREVLEVFAQAINQKPNFPKESHVIRKIFALLRVDEAKDLLTLPAESFKSLMSVYAGCYIDKFNTASVTDQFFYYLRKYLTDISYNCVIDFNALLDAEARNANRIEFCRLLLDVGADPLYCAMPEAEIKICPLLRAIQSNNSPFVSALCCAIKENAYKLDFEKLHTMCRDPLGLAVQNGASAEKVKLMIDAGFDIMRYDYNPPKKIPNIAAHILISKRRNQLLRHQRRRIAREIRLGFIQPVVSNDVTENTDQSVLSRKLF